MDADHLHHHLRELSERQPFLRTLKPDSDRYKLWLGDVVEFVNAAYGPESAEMSSLRAVLTGRPRLPAEAMETERQREYLARLDALAAVLRGYERNTRDPIILIDPDSGSGDGRA